ncbi:MAG: pterin-4-alpha-carbinolamine dehydratase [Caedibacter sp. 37-49]|nr:MAG: pterin-4-alpha-carbinolamine dehydratase [Caedibacter sp. 37-49]
MNKAGHLYKEFRFDNFIDAMTFANQIADMAEKEAHHPNLTITWGLCIVEIWTHDVGGLTENDFILAAKIGILK